MGTELGALARTVLDHDAEVPAVFTERDLVQRALALVAERGQSWTRSNLLRAISDSAPANLALAPDEVTGFLEGVADKAEAEARLLTPTDGPEGLAATYYRADGTSVFVKPGVARFATDDQLLGEAELRAAAVRRGAPAWSVEAAGEVIARFARNGITLSEDQAAALSGILTSGAAVEVLSAPAGTGKSFLVGTLAETWPATAQGSPAPGALPPAPGETDGPRVFAVAYGQRQADVLAEEGVTARNITAWLGAQDRLATGAGSPADQQLRLQRGDLLVVDEAGAAPTTDLVAIHRHCEAAGVKLLLVGDPRQIGAVGPGGALADIAERGIAYELAEVRRFTADWEGPASLRLREGDTHVVDDYDKHGRLVAAGTLEQAEAAASRSWLADTLEGRDALLIVGSNVAAARVSTALRAELVRLGWVEEAGVRLGMQDTVAGVGDLVQARRNGWHLTGYRGNTEVPVNRQTYRVTALAHDGQGLIVARVLGRDPEGGELLGEPMRLPAGYVEQHLALAYASTVHAAHGRTVDAGYPVIGPGTDAATAYVGLTRGRDTNVAYVVTRNLPAESETGETHQLMPRTAGAVLADIIRLPEHDTAADRTALAQAEHAAELARSTNAALDPLLQVITEHLAGRTSRLFDQLAATGELPAHHRAALAGDDARGTLDPLLRRAELAGHDPATVLRDAIAIDSLDGSKSVAQVLHFRIRTALDDTGDGLSTEISSYRDLLPTDLPEQGRAGLEALADLADTRRTELAHEALQAPPQWAVEALGPIPADEHTRREWAQAVGWAASYRELADHTDQADPLGIAPPAGLAEKHAIFRTAHQALDLPGAGADEEAMTEGKLRARVAAYAREENWAPHYVADELAATHEQLRRRTEDATVWAARADAAIDPTEAAQLRAAAEQARTEAGQLAEQVAQLEEADASRAAWWVETAVTRDLAERARYALGLRGIPLENPAERTTAAEWLAAERAAREADDDHRDIHEHDLTAQPVLEQAAAQWEPVDIRDTEPDAHEHTDPVERRRVPLPDDTLLTVDRAQAAIQEISRRTVAEREAAAHAAELEPDDDARRIELARWADEATDAHTSEHERGCDDTMER